MKERQPFVEAFLEFLVGEPDKVFEVSGEKLGGVGHLQLELGALGGIGKRIGYVGEGSSLGETASGLFEVFVYGDETELQTAGGRDVRRGEALAAGRRDRDELAFRPGSLEQASS